VYCTSDVRAFNTEDSIPFGMSLLWLFVDLNSYFASVEQQLDPAIRGRPVAVAPVHADSGCCIAVSYEGKKFGVKTGTRVREARRLCPDIVFVKPRHETYIRFHHAVLAAAETVMPIHAVHSIDEFSCRLGKGQRDAETARRLGTEVKAAIRERVGECLRCSVGVAPNRFLAKVGTEMQKPDGLVTIERHELPAKLFSLGLRDLPGIGAKMHERLVARGITSVEQLCTLPEQQVHGVWESVLGNRWYRWLRGDELDEEPTRTRSIGHQHVLGPQRRTNDDSRAVAMRLLHKAASRARSLGYVAQRLSLSLKYYREKGVTQSWHESCPLPGGEIDTLTLVAELAKLWDMRPPGPPMFVSVVLDELVSLANSTAPLFDAESNRRKLSNAIDKLDAKYGRLTVYSGAMHKAKDVRAGGIAFKSIPSLDLPDSVKDPEE
jgi:DNA polymerase-4